MFTRLWIAHKLRMTGALSSILESYRVYSD